MGSENDFFLSELVHRGMEELSAAHREVLILRYWEELTYAEISVVLGEPVGTVRSRLHWARKYLKNELEPVFDLREKQ